MALSPEIPWERGSVGASERASERGRERERLSVTDRPPSNSARLSRDSSQVPKGMAHPRTSSAFSLRAPRQEPRASLGAKQRPSVQLPREGLLAVAAASATGTSNPDSAVS